MYGPSPSRPCVIWVITSSPQPMATPRYGSCEPDRQSIFCSTRHRFAGRPERPTARGCGTGIAARLAGAVHYGDARDAIIHHGRVDPGVELVGKPFTQAELARRVRQVLDR